jgi:hypothetical protein
MQSDNTLAPRGVESLAGQRAALNGSLLVPTSDMFFDFAGSALRARRNRTLRCGSRRLHAGKAALRSKAKIAAPQYIRIDLEGFEFEFVQIGGATLPP